MSICHQVKIASSPAVRHVRNKLTNVARPAHLHFNCTPFRTMPNPDPDTSEPTDRLKHSI